MTPTTVQRSAWMAEELAGLVRLAHAALAESTSALLDERADAAERARAAAQAISALRETLEEDAGAEVSVTPLLGAELRPVVLGVHVGTEVEGIAEVGVQLVELAWLRRGREPLPERLRSPLRGMAAAALRLVAAAAETLKPSTRPQPASPGDDVPREGSMLRDQRLLYERMLTDAQPVDVADAADAVVLACRLVRAAHHAEAVLAQARLLVDQPPTH